MKEVLYPCDLAPSCKYVFISQEDLSAHMENYHITGNVGEDRKVNEVRSVSAKGGQKGVKLERFDLIPTGPLAELARHYGVGAKKYEAHQWRKGFEWSKAYAAALRHWNAFWGGEEYDVCPPGGEGCAFETFDGQPFTDYIPGKTCYNHTGSHHLAAAAWQAFCLLEFKDTHPDLDDRYLGTQDGL